MEPEQSQYCIVQVRGEGSWLGVWVKKLGSGVDRLEQRWWPLGGAVRTSLSDRTCSAAATVQWADCLPLQGLRIYLSFSAQATLFPRSPQPKTKSRGILGFCQFCSKWYFYNRQLSLQSCCWTSRGVVRSASPSKAPLAPSPLPACFLSQVSELNWASTLLLSQAFLQLT